MIELSKTFQDGIFKIVLFKNIKGSMQVQALFTLLVCIKICILLVLYCNSFEVFGRQCIVWLGNASQGQVSFGTCFLQTETHCSCKGNVRFECRKPECLPKTRKAIN